MHQPLSAQEQSGGVGREQTGGMGALHESRLLVEDVRRFYPRTKYQDKNLFICEDIVFIYRLATDPLSHADQQEGHAYRGDLFTM